MQKTWHQSNNQSINEQHQHHHIEPTQSLVKFLACPLPWHDQSRFLWNIKLGALSMVVRARDPFLWTVHGIHWNVGTVHLVMSALENFLPVFFSRPI
jgi:hypothetical protein